jgi:peptidoglycan/LPS O-acetylase OafA/YrhL
MTEGAAASSVTPDFAAKGTALLTTALLSGMAFMAWTRRPLAGPESWIMAGTAGAEASKEEAAVPVKKPSKPRLPALDSIRFFLISYIVVGHFIQTCVTDATILKLFTQINVVVGAFFVLSGYVAGYTGTLIGKREADPRIEPTHKYVIGKIMGYYPLHLLVTLIFAPMFIYADSYYNGFFKAAAHGLMSLTLVQSWFPMHAEIWNAPTWFLSAMSFAMVAMPSSIASIAKMSKKGLTQALVCLSGILLIPRLAYSYDLGVWSIMEGLLNARTHPNIAFWNSIRFNPFYALLEMLIGVVLARMVMLDTEEDKAKAAKPGLLSSLKNSPVWPLVGMVAVIVLRAYDVVGLNDVLTRSLLFLPLFGRFLINAHRQTLRDTEGTPSLTRLLAWKPLTYLGTISFPIFVLHGPLGQLFYKKVIAKQFVWGAYNSQPWFFWLYLAATVVGGALLHWAFVSRKWVGNATRATMKSLCDRFA